MFRKVCYLPAGLALIAAYHGPSTRSRAVSLNYTGTYLGTVLGGTLGGWMSVVYGWRAAFGVFGVIGCVYGLFLLFFLRDKQAPEVCFETAETAPLPEALRRVFASTGFAKILIVFAAASVCDWTIYTWMPLYLYQTMHFSLVKAGFAATFYIKAGGFAGLLIGGYLADTWASRSARGRIGTQTIGLLCAAPCLSLCGVTHSAWLLYGAMAVFGVGKAAYDGNTMPVLCESVPASLRATAMGVLNFAGTFAGGLMALVAGALQTNSGLRRDFYRMRGANDCRGVIDVDYSHRACVPGMKRNCSAGLSSQLRARLQSSPKSQPGRSA